MAISRSDMERQLRNMGGIMSLQEPRQGYFLGKIVKKAKRAVKKVVKSPIGKAAILAAPFLMGGAGAGGLSSIFGKAKGLGSLISGLGSKVSGMSTLGKLGLIGGVSGLGGLMAARGQQEEDDDESIFDRGEGLDIDRIVRLARQNDPQFRFLPPAEFTGAYAEGGEVDKTTAMIMDLLKRGMDDDSISTITGASQEQIDSIKKNKREEKAEGGDVNDRSTIKEIFDDDTPKTQSIVDLSEGFTLSPITILRRILAEKELEEKRKKKAEGGIMNLGGMEMDLRGGGFVPLGAKEKADDVPARLSKNEFVMTADAVRAAGGGSVDKGADKMYKLMKGLEAQV